MDASSRYRRIRRRIGPAILATQVRTAIEVLKKLEERIDNHATFNTMQSPETRGSDDAAARIEAQTIEQIARVKTVMA